MRNCHHQTLFSLLVVVLQVLLKSYAYDIRCIWPRSLGDDLFAIRYEELGILPIPLLTDIGAEEDIVQPFILRGGVYTNSCAVLCLAYHDPDVLNPFTMGQTFTTVPPFGHNAYSIAMCQYQCWIHIYEGIPEMVHALKDEFNDAGLDVSMPFERLDIQVALLILLEGGSDEPIMAILQQEDYHPYTMGHVVGFEVRNQMEFDGFNELGTTRWCPILSEEVPCSANCRPYQDTTGYEPVPNPRINPFLSTDSNKYECTGYCRHWQPEQNMGSDRGSIMREEFNLPHIGRKAKTFLRDAEVTLEDPEYDYHMESLQVVQRLRETSIDVLRKRLVQYFHGQPYVGMHQVRGQLQRKAIEPIEDIHSYQEDSLYYLGLGIVEYESIIHSWREKVHHDLVRPATVIKQWGDDDLLTYGGDFDFPGPVHIKARDFEPLLPNIESTPEFPSENTCYCQSLMEFIDSYLDDVYGITLENIDVDIYPGFVFQNMTDFRDKCAQSRLDGGYHYPASVTAGIEKCRGLGTLGTQFVRQVRNNSNFNGGYYVNDTLPECPN